MEERNTEKDVLVKVIEKESGKVILEFNGSDYFDKDKEIVIEKDVINELKERNKEK